MTTILLGLGLLLLTLAGFSLFSLKEIGRAHV